jgi:hypothetical protein
VLINGASISKVPPTIRRIGANVKGKKREREIIETRYMDIQVHLLDLANLATDFAAK